MDTTGDGLGTPIRHNSVLVSCHVQKHTVRAHSAGEAQDSAWTQTPYTFFYIGTERMSTSSLVPFRSFPCSLERVKTRPQVLVLLLVRYVQESVKRP